MPISEITPWISPFSSTVESWRLTIDPFAEVVKELIAYRAIASSIFLFLKTKGYKGGYSTVKRFCKELRKQENK